MISDDEKAQFQEAMEGVKKYADISVPIVTKKPIAPKKISFSKKIIHTDDTLSSAHKPSFLAFSTIPAVSGSEILSHAKSGVQTKKITQLKKDKIKSEATLDLHDHTRDQALLATDAFITRCQKRGYRTVCIIHGKGLCASNDEPVLKNMLNHYLRLHPSVLAFHSSKNNTGSMVVLLKNTLS